MEEEVEELEEVSAPATSKLSGQLLCSVLLRRVSMKSLKQKLEHAHVPA